MAITAIHYSILRSMFEQGVLPQHGAMLELGEANWYGDVSALAMVEDIKRFVSDPVRRDALVQRITEVVEKRDPETGLFDAAKVYYELFFAPSEMQVVDYHGTRLAQKLDLNGPVPLNRRFEVVINNGTAEHIFNIGQVFRTVHDVTVPGGLMIHEGPFRGWVDHGFYNPQPTLFFDVAEFNRYEILGMFVGTPGSQTVFRIASREQVYAAAKNSQIPENALLFTYLKKAAEDGPFRIPMQGYYREGLSEAGMNAWRELR